MKSEAQPDAAPARLLSIRRGASLGQRLIDVEEFGVIVALVTMVTVIAAFHPRFFGVYSLSLVASSASFYGIMALGMVFLLAMREIDLSVGGIYGVSVISGALLIQDGLNPWLAALLALAIAMGLGIVNGVLANALALPTIIITLGTLSGYRGIALIISNSESIYIGENESSFFRILGAHVWGLDVSVWALLLLTILLSVVFKATRFGYTVRAIGSNPHAARLSGIPIKIVRLKVMALMGALCGVSGVLTLAYYGGADPLSGTGYELLVIAAAIIGGTGLAGGTGTVLGAMLGALLIALIQSGLIQFGVTANWSAFVTGVVIISAVALDRGVRVLRARRVAGA